MDFNVHTAYDQWEKRCVVCESYTAQPETEAQLIAGGHVLTRRVPSPLSVANYFVYLVKKSFEA